MLFIYDSEKVPVQWFDNWWGHAFDWVVRLAEDCSFDGPESLLLQEETLCSVERAVSRKTDEPIEGVAPPVVEPLEGHLR